MAARTAATRFTPSSWTCEGVRSKVRCCLTKLPINVFAAGILSDPHRLGGRGLVLRARQQPEQSLERWLYDLSHAHRDRCGVPIGRSGPEAGCDRALAFSVPRCSDAKRTRWTVRVADGVCGSRVPIGPQCAGSIDRANAHSPETSPRYRSRSPSCSKRCWASIAPAAASRKPPA